MPFGWSSVGAGPAADQFELSVFGPGFGECALVHIAHGVWTIVDSCIDPGDPSTCVPEAYLRAIGVDLQQVQLIIATHWHDDHVKGISRMVEICREAKFSCALALLQNEFATYLDEMATGGLTTEGAKVTEFRRVLRTHRSRDRPIKYANGGRVLRAWQIGQLLANDECRITALSPSDREYDLFLQAIGGLRPKAGEPMRSAPRRTPNLASVVLNVAAGPVSVLLGADMENHNDSLRGWSAVVSEGLQTVPPASLFKVAHHGSINGDHDAAWAKLLTERPLAAITPFNRLKDSQKLPRPEDVARIKAKSSRVFLTADPRLGGRRRARNPAVLRSLRESGIATREPAGDLGLVRFRRVDSAWEVELFGAAVEM